MPTNTQLKPSVLQTATHAAYDDTPSRVDDHAPLFDPRLFPSDFANRSSKVERLARKLATTAVQRDRQGGSAQAERQLLRDSGLLTLAIPQQFGGQGLAACRT